MDLTKKEEEEIKKLLSNKKNEFEIRLSGEYFESKPILHQDFFYIVNHLIYSREKNGLGLDYKLNSTLDIQNEEERISIKGKNTIKMYWLKNKLYDDNIKYSVLKKTNLKKYDLNEYNIRFSSSLEENQDKKTSEILRSVNSNILKTFRFKNRFQIESEDKIFRYDLTMIKMGKGTTIRESNVFKKKYEYEIELECVKPELSLEEKYKSLKTNLNILLELYQKNKTLIKNSEKSKIIKLYEKVVKKDKFLTANPVSLQIINLNGKNNILKNYGVTYKADGYKRLLIINEEGQIYLIDNSFNVYKTEFKIDKKYKNTIIECEKVKDKYLVYDILFYKGDDKRNLYFNFPSGESRYKLLKTFVETINIKLIDLKKYYFGNMYEKSRKLWEKKDDIGYNVDGLIFIPEHESYPIKGGTWNLLYKWKPMEYNSIDFLVKIKQNKDNKDIIKPYIETSKLVPKKIRQYKILELYVGGFKDGEYVSKIFEPFNEINIFLDNNNKMMTIHNEEILNDTIIEFVYDELNIFKWIPIKVRYDKTEKYKNGENMFGNNEKVAINVWNSIKNPITEEMITTGKNIPTNTDYYVSNFNKNNNKNNFREFHNKYVKNMLIKEVSPSIINNLKTKKGYLLDLACGRSGDLPKWSDAKYEKVIGIDISENCIEQSNDFYNNYNGDKPDVEYYCGDSSKLIFPNYDINNLLEKVIPSKYIFDVVSIQFCLHYFFKNEKLLNGLLLNITDNLKIGGYLIGTCFNGQNIYNKLKGVKNIKGDNWKIIKKYKNKTFGKSIKNFGREISVFIKSIGKPHTEYLVDLKYFEKICLKYGLKLIRYQSFEDIFNDLKNFKMSDSDKNFSFFNTLFVFQKIENISPKLYTKYLKMK